MIDIFCERKYEVGRSRIRTAIESCLAENKVSGDIELSVSIVGSDRMKSLHQKYLETYEVTDVISFPLEEKIHPDGVLRLGDIVVCFPVAQRQAKQNARSIDEEIDFLVDHGCRHLLGIHHD